MRVAGLKPNEIRTMHNRKSSLSSRGSMLIRLLRAVGLVPLVLAGAAWGQTLYWDGTQTNWTTLSGWSTASGAVTPDPLFAPGLINDVVFNISTVNANQTVNITTGTTVNAFSLLFNNTGTTTLQSTTTTAATLSLRAGGLTVASGAGTVTIGNTNLLTVSTQGAQTWSLAGGTTPEEFTTFVKTEIDKWAKVAKAARVQVE
jgi:hypothetical protein